MCCCFRVTAEGSVRSSVEPDRPSNAPCVLVSQADRERSGHANEPTCASCTVPTRGTADSIVTVGHAIRRDGKVGQMNEECSLGTGNHFIVLDGERSRADKLHSQAIMVDGGVGS